MRCQLTISNQQFGFMLFWEVHHPAITGSFRYCRHSAADANLSSISKLVHFRMNLSNRSDTAMPERIAEEVRIGSGSFPVTKKYAQEPKAYRSLTGSAQARICS